MNAVDFEKQANDFLTHIEHILSSENVELENHWNVDHLCYRASTADEYHQLKTDFQQFSDFLGESPVNGRPISTFKLSKPVMFLNWTIDLVELPSPKPSKPMATGFDHIEVVCDIPLHELRKKDLRSAVKFHHLSLESVVRFESNKPVFEATQKLGVLTEFAANAPLVAGTFPLGISTPGSDVDILMCSQDLKATKERLVENYSHHQDFKVEDCHVLEVPTVIASFTFMDVPFEVFVQNIDSVRQQAYRHFLVEERLLKLGGASFTTKIKAARGRGLKTEPAFAEVLNLKGDPFQALLELQTLDEASLKKKLMLLIEKAETPTFDT
jgi:uncharacterized protein